jgi:hypothetical protein
MRCTPVTTKRIRVPSCTSRKKLAPYRGKHDDGRHSSRVMSGKDLLPNEDGRSRWARLLRATMQAMIAHCGDAISDTQRMACRRIGALEAELVFQEDRIAKIRRCGKEPPASLLKTYSLLSYQQRRLMIDIGWDRSLKENKPSNEPADLADYINSKAKAKSNGHASRKDN